MSSKQTTWIGIFLGAITVVFGALQPYLQAGGTIDYKVVIPAVVIALVHYLEKQNGSWKTTFVYSLIAAIGTGASTFIANPGWSWAAIIVSVLVALGGYWTSDKTSAANGTSTDSGSPATNSSPPPQSN